MCCLITARCVKCKTRQRHTRDEGKPEEKKRNQTVKTSLEGRNRQKKLNDEYKPTRGDVKT